MRNTWLITSILIIVTLTFISSSFPFNKFQILVQTYFWFRYNNQINFGLQWIEKNILKSLYIYGMLITCFWKCNVFNHTLLIKRKKYKDRNSCIKDWPFLSVIWLPQANVGNLNFENFLDEAPNHDSRPPI